MIKQIHIKIFNPPDNRSYIKFIRKAPSGQFITEQGIENEIAFAVNKLETGFPQYDYRMIKLSEVASGKGRIEINFVCIGLRPVELKEPEYVNSQGNKLTASEPFENEGVKGDDSPV